jgi:hypothetical protein
MSSDSQPKHPSASPLSSDRSQTHVDPCTLELEASRPWEALVALPDLGSAATVTTRVSWPPYWSSCEQVRLALVTAAGEITEGSPITINGSVPDVSPVVVPLAVPGAGPLWLSVVATAWRPTPQFSPSPPCTVLVEDIAVE